MNINVFAKFDEILSLPVQVIKEKNTQNVADLELQRAIALKELAPSPYVPYFFYYKCSSSGYQCVCEIS